MVDKEKTISLDELLTGEDCNRIADLLIRAQLIFIANREECERYANIFRGRAFDLGEK